MMPSSRHLFTLIIIVAFIIAGCHNNKTKQTNAPGYHNPLVQPLTNALAKDPDNPQLLYNRSRALIQVNAPKLAKIDLQNALKQDSNNLQYRYVLSQVNLKLKNNSEAINNLKILLQKSPNAAPARILLAKAYLQNKDNQNAQKALQPILDVDSAYPGALFTLAQIQMAQKDTVSAIAILEHSITLRIDNYSSSLLLAKCLAAQHKHKAIQQFRTTFDMDTTNIAPLVALGKYYEQEQLFKKAKEIYYECLLKFPGNTSVLINSGKLLMTQDSFKKAIRILKIAVNSMPNSAEAYYLKGLCFEKTKQADSASMAFSQALIFRPDWQDAKEALKRNQPKKGFE